MGRRKRKSYVGCSGFNLFKRHCKRHLNVPLWRSRACKGDSKYIFLTIDLPLQKICQTPRRLESSTAAREGCRRTCLLSNPPAVLLVWHFVFLLLPARSLWLLSSCIHTGCARCHSSCPGTREAPGRTGVNAKPFLLGWGWPVWWFC